MFSFLSTDKPGVSLSTANVVIPLYPYVKRVKHNMLAIHLYYHKAVAVLFSTKEFTHTYSTIHTHVHTFEKSTLAITRKRPACSAFVIHDFWPLMT